MSNVTPLAEADFIEKVFETDELVLVDFWAEWCGPCRQVAPILDELSVKYGDKITFYSVNVDENPQIAAHLKVTGIPNLKISKGRELVAEVVGAKPRSALDKLLADVIAAEK